MKIATPLAICSAWKPLRSAALRKLHGEPPLERVSRGRCPMMLRGTPGITNRQLTERRNSDLLYDLGGSFFVSPMTSSSETNCSSPRGEPFPLPSRRDLYLRRRTLARRLREHSQRRFGTGTSSVTLACHHRVFCWVNQLVHLLFLSPGERAALPSP